MRALRTMATAPIRAGRFWSFNSAAMAGTRRREHVLCLGDSHMEVMRHVHVPGVRFRVVAVPGATASGANNPNSKTQALPIFLRALQRAKPWQHILMQLGEVDCGFVIWHRAGRHGLSIDDQLQETLASYGELISRVAGYSEHAVLVMSAPAPTITDEPHDWGQVANFRREVGATQAERTLLTLRFNKGVEQLCGRLGAVFIDATTGHINDRTGLLSQEFRRRASKDHHLASRPYARLISEVWPKNV